MASHNKKVSHSLDEQKSRFKLTALARAVKAIGKRRQNSPHKQIKFESLEPRVLLSADPFSAALASTFGEDWSQQSETHELSTDALAYLSPVLESAGLETGWFKEATGDRTEKLVLGQSFDELLTEAGTDTWIIDESATQVQLHIAFVDSRVEGYETLLDSLLPVANNEGGSVPVIEVVLLDADRDGVEQIEEYLANQQGISAVHILAHGSEGSLSLGSAILDAASLDEYSGQLGRWGSALTADADILLYGCNIASGEWGAEFVRNFAVLTGADVAASDDATGSAVLGGDWDLELTVGSIETFSIAQTVDVSGLTSLLQDGVVVSTGSGIFSGYAKDDAIAGGILDLRGVTNPLKWTIGADGQVTIESQSPDPAKKGSLKVKDVTILKAGSGQNDFIILNNAEFGSNSQSASIIGNGTSTTLSFTPNLANPDALFTSNRVTSGINNVDLDSATDVINFGKVWFTATSITKVVGGKGNDEFDGGDAQSSILVGGRGDDTLIGGSQPGDLLKGGVGDDTLIGDLGSDFLEGGGDDDHLYGALKDASLATPETGTDSLAGGKGDDTYYFLGNWGTDQVDERSGEGTDTLDFTDLNAPLKVEVGVSIYNFTDGVKVSQSDNAANTAEASNVEVVKLGEGANTIVVNDNYGATSGNRLTISNALRTTQTVTDDALAKLDLSNLNTGVEITIEAFTYKTEIGGTPVTNPNGNKVTVTFESGAKLIVFNVESIDGTDKNDKVTFKDGAVLDGTLDLGDGSNEVIVNGDVSRIFGSIFGGDGFDLLRIGSGVTTLDSLTTEDEAKIASISDVIKKLKGLADTDTLDLDALYGVQLSTNPTGILPFDTLAFDAVIADKGGKTGVAIIAGDSRSLDVNTIVGKKDLLQGGSRDDILFGGMYEGTIKGGDGDDIIVAGSGNEEIRGESGADVYVFSGNWGQDTIKPGFTEDAEDTLDFSSVDESITYVLRAGKIYVGTGDTATFDYNTTQFTTAANTVTVAGTQNLGNNIGVIKISGGANQASQKQVFEFGNDWERTTIEVPAGTDPNLVLDFSRVYETLRFDFKSDGSLVITQLGGNVDQVKDLIPGKSKSVTITHVGANTKIITGSNENIYRSGGAAKFDGELVMTGGPQKIRIPFTERFVDSGLLLGDVEHTIDLGESLGGAAQTAQTVWNNLFPGGDAGPDIAAAGQTLINALSSRINFVSLAGQGGRTPLSFLPDGWFSDALTGLEYEKFTAENGAEIDNVYLNGLALNVVIGDLLLPGDRGDNTFSTKQFQPAVNVLAGLTGADTYEFNNFWGLGVVLEIPDLDLGVPLPESTDTLSFSGVYGQDIIVDVYDSIAAAGDQFTDLLNGLGIDVSDFLSSFTASDGSIISTNVVIARSILPLTGTTTSFVVANDIESLVGPSALGTMTVRMHGDANLRGTVAPGAKGDVVLDYSDYSGAVETRLETLNVPLGDFGLTNFGIDQFFKTINVDSPFPESTSGRATGIDGNRLGGLTTFYDFFADLTNAEQESLLEDFAAGTVTKVIGSQFADTHVLSSVDKAYELGQGDILLAPTEFELFGLSFPDILDLKPDIKTIGGTTLTFNTDAGTGVELNLSTGKMTINGVTSDILAPTAVTNTLPDGTVETVRNAFAYTVYSGLGDDDFTGSTEVDTFVFEGDWGHDTIDLTPGKTSGVVDVLDFSRVLFELRPSIDVDGNLVIAKTDGNSSVTIIGGLDVAGLIEWFGIDDIAGAIGALVIDSLGGSLLAAQPSALTTLDVVSIESLVADAMQAFDGKTLIPFGETDPVNLSFVDTASDGSAVSQLVRADTGAVVLDASTLSFTVANLASTELSARDSAGAITVDTTAADNGWYTGAADPAINETGVDLLSVLVYEIGLKLGIDPSLTFMSALLDAGARVAVAGDVIADDLGTQVDTTVPTQTALEVASLPAGAITASDDLSGTLAEAINRWSLQQFSIAGTPWVDPTSVLTGITILVDDLDGDELARTLENGDIVLDYTAAGHGWYIAAADPLADETGVDLLTVLMHELGHKLGVDHTNAAGSALMSTEIGPGERRGIPGGTIVLFPLVAEDVTALDDGLGAFSTWAGALGKNLDDYLAGTNIPFTDKTITQLLGISSSAEDLVLAATSGLQAAVSAALADGNPSAADVLAIDGSTGTDYTFTIDKAPNANPNTFVATFDLLPGGAPTAGLDLSSLQLENVDLGFSVDTDLQLSINADLQLVVEFGLDQDDAFYVRSPELLAELEITSGDAGFGATVSLGPIGLSVVDGSIDVTASTRLSAGGFINTAGLLANVVDPAVIDPDTSAKYAIDLPIQLAGGISGVTTDDVAIRASGILPTGAGDLPAFLQGMDIQFQNFDQLFQLRGISLDALLSGIVTVIDALIADDGLIYKTIPGINQSIAELLSEQLGLNGADVLGTIKAEIVKVQEEQSLTGVEDALNGIFNDVFGAGTDPVTIRLEDSVLILDLEFEKLIAGFSQSFDLDLATFASELGLDALIGAENVAAIADKLKIEGDTIDLFADILVGFNIGVGLDLRNVLDPEQIISSDTGIFVKLDAGFRDPVTGLPDPVSFDVNLDISDIDLASVLDIAGFDILPDLDTVGFGVDDATADLDLLLEFGLPDTPDGFYDIDAVPAAEIRASGQAAVDLPLVIGSFPIGGSDLDNNGDGFNDNVLHVGATFTDGDFDFEFASPGMDKLISLAGFLNDPENIVKGLDKIFKVLEDKVSGQLSSLDLPFIGGALSDAQGFFDDGVDGSGTDLRDKVIGKIRELQARPGNEDATTIDLVAQALIEGLNEFLPANAADALGVTLGGDFVEFNLELAGTLFTKEVLIDLGIPGDLLTFGPDGKVMIDLGYTFAFGFGFSIDDGFYLNTDGATEGGEEFLLDLSATVDGIELIGELPILQVAIKDLTGTADDNDDLASGIFGSFSIDLQDDGNDGKLTIGEGATVEARLVAEANVDLGLTVAIPSPDSDSPLFPTITTTFRYDQILADIGTSGTTIAATPTVIFEDVELNLGEFISGFVQPIIDVVSVATKPLEPLVDFLNEPITLLMDLLGSDDDITLLTIAQGLADSGIIESSKVESALKFIGALSDIVNLVGDVEDFITNAGDDAILINFGSFTVSGGAAQPDAQNPTNPTDQAGSADPAAGSLVAGFSEGGFRFPLLTDPSTIFGLLLGESVDLFIYDLPALGLDFNYVKSFPIYPGLNARFGGAISASTNIGFGFDTSGFNAWKEGGFVTADIPLIFDGLFLDDHVTFDADGNIISDDPEATISATIIAGASVGVPGLIEAGVDGGITGGLEFDLNDLPNENTGPGTPLPAEYDGKLRGRELLTRFLQTDELFPGFVIPCVFDINGTVSFGLDAFFWVGIDLGFFGKATIFEARTTFLSGVLASFDFSCPDPEQASLANVNETTGEVAIIANRADGAFTVARQTVEVDGLDQEFLVIRTGSSFQYVEYDKVSKLVFNGTEGNDQIVIGAGLDGIELHIDGKGGNDRIAVASGGLAATRVFIRGGADNDEIVVAETVLGNLDIDGGAGDDRIMVSSDGSNTVLIHGGSGNDRIIGSEYADTIYGDGGRDVLLGLGGADIIYGGDLDQAALDAEIAALPAGALPPSVDDLIYGGDGSDEIHGGTGNDRLIGEAGSDKLFGDDGEDSLDGGLDLDELRGGADRDTIIWSHGDGEDPVWDGGDGWTIDSEKTVDIVQISGVVYDSNGATIATDDTVTLSRDGSTDDVAVTWARTGVAGSNNAFSLTNIERISVDLGSGSDELTVTDLDLTTIESISVDFGTTETITTTVVNAGTDSEEEFLARNVQTDGENDVLNLFGSDAKDIFTVESTTTGLLVEQSKRTASSDRKVLDISIYNPGSADDRLNIDTGKNDDIIDASSVYRNDLTAIGITAGEDHDIVIGSPFIDDIDSGTGDDQVTGGAGVDLFTDASGDDKLFEARDVNFTLSDVELVVQTLDVGTVVVKDDGSLEVSGALLPGTVAVYQPDGSIKVTRAVTGSEVEDISGIFEEVYLTGASQSDGIDGTFSVNIFNVADFTGDAFLNGSAAADIYNIQLSGGAAATFTSFIDIIDDGGADNAGIDVLNLEGTNEADIFRFDTDIVERLSAGDGSDALAAFARVDNFSTDIITRDKGGLDPNISVQTVNYLTTEDMVIHGRGGDDLFIVDDSSTELFVYGDSGDDSFFIGSVLKTMMVLNPNGSGEYIEVVDRDGGLTNGVSFPAMFYGGKGNDYFEVNHNIAEISLFGEDGDDIFFLKALLTTEPSATDNYQAQEDINVYSEAGESDTLAYVNNAPVNIFGGEGFDTLVIVGTVIDDTFVIFTEFDHDLGREVQRIYGAGLVVPVIDSIERIQLITGAGDDTVYLYGTLDDQEILINTGGGNDVVQIGGEEFSFDVTIPESSYTKVNAIPQPDQLSTAFTVIQARTWYELRYERLFGFFGPAWIPTLVRRSTPEVQIPRLVRTEVPDLLVSEVVTVPEFNLEITVPESRDLDSISGPVFIDGQQAGDGDDAIVVDNRNGLTTNPGILQKNTVEAADINTTDAEVAAAKIVLFNALQSAGIDANVDVIYSGVASYLEDQNRVRQQGLLDGMLLANRSGSTTVDLRAGQRVQAFATLVEFNAYLPATATQGTYTEVNAISGVTDTKTFSIASLLASGGNEFLPDDVFTVNVGGVLGTVEVELLYNVNGDLTGINVFAETALTFDLDNEFVQSKTVDADSTRIYDALSGFGLGIGIFYENFSLIDLQLSNDHDVLTINDTTADAVTNVFAGGGDDRIEVNDTSGTLNIFGDVAGSDTGGLGITSGVAGTYSEDFTDADNAAAIGQVLGLGGSFDADNVNHIRALIKVLNVEFPGTVNVPDPDNTIFKEINLDVFDFRAQTWELLKSEVNTLLGETSDYRSFLDGAGAFANFSTDLGNYVGVAAAFNPSSQAHLAALAAKVNAKNFSLTVEIDLAGNANNLSRDLDVYSSFVSLLLGPDGLNIAEDATIDDYRNFLPELGVALQLGQDFDVNNRSHLQFLASLVNNKRFDTTVTIDVNGTAAELNAALETFQGFVWRTLKEDLQRANSTPYNPLAETGDYRTQLTRLGSILSLPGAFDADGVNDVKLLGARLNDQFNDLGIDVDGIRLEPNIDLGQYELEIWKLITEVNPLIEVPAGNDTFNVQQSDAEIFIWGQRGNDTVNLNDAGLGAWLTALGQQGDDDFNVYNLSDLTTESNRGDGRGLIRDSVDFDGGSGLDEYYVDLTGGSTDYRINVLDTGVGGEDTLTIEGTSAADTFLMRRVTELPGYTADSPAFVALLHGTIEEILANESTRPDTYERINYDANIDGFLRVNGLAGDDYFASDDNSTTTILDGGADKDTFQIGQVYRTARVDDSVNPEDAFSTIQTTRGYLSRGVSYETQIIGGTEDDRIVVYSNAAELTLEGNGGNDSFEVRAFELAGGGFSTESGTDINTGDGDDTVQYNVNAPVNIDGGTGFDTIVVLGTESNDNFVVTAETIYGAGLFVSYSGAESIQIDGLEGDDTFFILSTAANVLTTVIGGLGSDTFNVGGDVTEAITSAGWDEGDNVQQRTLTEILGPLVIEGHYLEGANRSLSAPVMLPGEISEAIADGDVLDFLGTGESSALDVMQVATTAVAAGLNRENGSSDLQDLIGLTLEITDGSGEGRFWSIQGVTDNLDGTVQLSLRNPSVLESAGIADIGVPGTSSSFAISQLNPSFFADEAIQIDTLNVFNDGSVVDDTGTLQAKDVNNSLVTLEAALNLSGLGMGTGFVADLGTTDTSDDITFDGGITMDDLEILEILLGQGNDTLTIEDTLRNPENHGGITIVHGGGNTLTGTGEMGGDTITINGGGGANSPLVVYGDTSQDGSRYAGTQDATPETLANSFSNAGNDTIDARNASETVTLYGGEGDDEIWGGSAGDNLAGGSGNDEIHGQGGTDLIYGDSGINVDSLTRLMTVPTANTSTNPNKDDLKVGNDTLHGDDGEDVIFGDHGIVTQADPAAALWTAEHAAINRIESTEITKGGDDIIYGGADGDILIGGSNTLNGTRGGDSIDGGAGDDLIFGDNVVLEHRAAGGGQTADPRLRTLDGAEIYVTGGPDDGEVAPNSSVDSGHPQVTATWAEYLITDLNHSASIEAAGDRNFGDDYIAGGADDDTIFGQLGDDVIQGDGSIGDGITDRVGASRDETTGALTLNASTEADTDGDDYIEGNGGNDVIFGNLGQDDIVGGSSSLFTLVDADLRPDGSDILFGGSGQRVERNYQVPVGDDANPDTIVLGSLHAEDSDAIAGDNANIYRLVGTNGSDTGAFLSFQYDAGRGTESIIVRAVDLIDYTPGGSEYDPVNAPSDIGADDEIHGGPGDDFIYGMKGSDLLFGDSEDDDLIGGYGNDWISGGAGSDGVLGDDGRIYTSRNTQSTFAGQMAEPLYGIAALAQTDLEISTPGNAQQAIINVSGALKKTANLTPFNVDPLEDNLYRAQDADDIIFGGLGNDFLHGGSGDDAISGAEAIASGFAVSYPDDGTSDANRTDGIVISFGFDNPVNPGNILGYSGLRAGEFAAYDEFNPRHRIVSETGEEYFLNFNASEGEEVEAGIFSDGDDVIFGDLGNDWVVGGTGQDNMYGGRGDDLLNADDDHGSNGGLNDVTDTSDSYADRAFGGAGRDVLIANTGVDRLIDWAGEFNTYLVPFSPFGPPTISRALPPRLFDFLYDLSASDGADPTRAADEGSDGARNGEPFGELGLVIQKDFGWQDQTGAPDDPQPGNIPGGSRDVVRQATFNQGTAESFLPDVGDWSVSGSRLQVSPETLGGDAVSVYYADVVLPTYFEMQATIQGGKPTAGLKSNAYLIFDYQSPTDFKFAGVNVSTDKLEMGHRDESGWHVDVTTNAKLRPNTDYNLLLALNGTAATLVVNNKDVLNFAFEARVDPDGYSYGFNSGMVGIGAFNSVASIDNVKLQVLPRDVEMIRQSDFDSGPVDFLTGDSVGQWQIANGYLVGDGSVNGLSTAWGGQIAYTTSDVRIAAEQVVEIEATLEAGGAGGIVFDQYGETDFKFVYIDESGVVSIGHQTGQRWDIEASAQMPNQVKGDYDIRVALVGTTVSVIIDNQTVVSFAYNALTGDGAIGLLAAGSNARFDNISISTNDSAYLDASTGDALRAAGDAAGTPGITLEDGVNLQPLLDASVERWSSWLGETLPGADGLSIWITDLPDELLGLTVGDVIYVDSDAAGRGWFVDETPKYDNEFDATGNALAGTDAANGIDLLSVIAHEVGHVLGYDHDTLQTSTLSVGTRLVPEIRDAGDEPLHRNAEISSDLLNSLIDVSKRIVPVNLGMFGAVHRQIPWAFPDDASLADSDLHAMMWNEEAGEFETAKPVKPARIADDRPEILEFLEETGDWVH